MQKADRIISDRLFYFFHSQWLQARKQLSRISHEHCVNY